MKLILVLATHRTGTNYLRSVLNQRSDCLALGEVFHEKEAFGLRRGHLDRLGQAAGAHFLNARDPTLLDWLHHHPVQAVRLICEVAERKGLAAVFLKVFFGHFTTPVPGTVAKMVSLPGCMPVVLRRRPLDVFISNCKASALKTWQQSDTTALRVAPQPAQYQRWAQRARTWYEQVHQGLNQADRAAWCAHYDTDIAMPADALARHWAHRLGMAPPATSVDDQSVLRRQDLNTDWRNKLTNAEAFEAGLRQLGLWEKALTGFDSTPLAVDPGLPEPSQVAA